MRHSSPEDYIIMCRYYAFLHKNWILLDPRQMMIFFMTATIWYRYIYNSTKYKTWHQRTIDMTCMYCLYEIIIVWNNNLISTRRFNYLCNRLIREFHFEPRDNRIYLYISMGILSDRLRIYHNLKSLILVLYFLDFFFIDYSVYFFTLDTYKCEYSILINKLYLNMITRYYRSTYIICSYFYLWGFRRSVGIKELWYLMIPTIYTYFWNINRFTKMKKTMF